MTVDLVVAGGLVYFPDGWRRTNITISEGKIVGLHSPSQMPTADRVIDAKELLVAPGLIDSHVHMQDPGFSELEDFETGTRAAAAGGVTMVGDMPTNKPPITSGSTFRQKVDCISSKAVVDYGLWAGATNVSEIPKLIELGALGIKIWTVAALNSPELTVSEDWKLLNSMRKIAEVEGVCIIHPSSQRIFSECCSHASSNEEQKDETRHRSAYQTEDDFISETVSMSGLLAIARFLNLPLHIAHIRSEQAIKLVNQARSLGQRVSLEANPKYLFLTGNPGSHHPWGLTPEQAEILWRRILDGTVDVIATDHAPLLRETVDKLRENHCYWSCGLAFPSGPQIEDYLSLLLDKAEMDMSVLSTVIRCCSENPARLLGLYPHKGAITLGADADLVILNPKLEHTINPENMYTKLRWSIYEGRRLKGKPVKTIVRGTLVMDDGVVVGKPGFGSLVRGSNSLKNTSSQSMVR